jgi:hypothetical protein
MDKWKGFLIFGGWMIPLAVFLFARDSDAYKEWSDPRTYWAQKVASSEAWVAETRRTVIECASRLEQLRSEYGRQTWIAAKRLEGRTIQEATADHSIEVSSQKYACDGMKVLLDTSERALQEERRKLQQAR